MKILFLTNLPSPYRVNFFNELAKSVDLTVLFERESAKDRNKKWRAEEEFHFSAVVMQGILIGNDMAFCKSVTKYLSDKTYDFIVIGQYSSPTAMYAIQYMKRKKIPFILSADGGFVKNDRKIKHFIKSYFISAAAYWLSSGKRTTEYFLYYGADRERIFTYPFTSIYKRDIILGLDVQKKQSLRQELKLQGSHIVIAVGSFIPRKGMDVLIKAAKRFTQGIEAYLIGDEPTEEYLKMIEEYHISNVHFEGFKSKMELQKYYQAADLFVLPTRSDIWGLVINEAMAAGLPVITTDQCIAGLELIQEGKNGYIVPADQAEILAEKVNQVFEEDRSRQMGIESLKKIQEYTIEKMAESHITVWNQIEGIKKSTID